MSKSSGPAKLVAIICVLFGLVAIGGGVATWAMITNQLSAENITVPKDSPLMPGAKVQAANVTFGEADLPQPWPVESGCVDLAVCTLVLDNIEDLCLIFAEASRVLLPGGRFFVCELHPFRQYQGTVANFQAAQGPVAIDACVHHISDFLAAAEANGFMLERLAEWWHEEDSGKPPRLVSFIFAR